MLDDATPLRRRHLVIVDPHADLTFQDIGELVFAAVRVRRDHAPGLEAELDDGVRVVRPVRRKVTSTPPIATDSACSGGKRSSNSIR
jgi:hypothetical protein